VISNLRRVGELPPRFLEALERQEQLHRRRPELKIHGSAQTKAMVQELGLVSVNAATDLPNLIDPIVGRRASGAERVYQEPATILKGWLPSILEDPDILQMKLFSGEATLLARRLWPLVDPLARHFGRQAREGELVSPAGRKILALLDRHGPLRVERIRKELGLRTVTDSKAFKLAREELDSYCLMISWDDPDSPRDPNRVLWETWNRFSERNIDRRLIPRSIPEALEGLGEAAIKACVMASEKSIARWFPWTKEEASGVVKQLLHRGIAERLSVQKDIWILVRS